MHALPVVVVQSLFDGPFNRWISELVQFLSSYTSTLPTFVVGIFGYPLVDKHCETS